jgi:hypothetical protein
MGRWQAKQGPHRPIHGLDLRWIKALVGSARKLCGLSSFDVTRFAAMEWELGLPLLVIGATGVAMAFIAYAAKKLLFEPRQGDHTDDGTESSA